MKNTPHARENKTAISKVFVYIVLIFAIIHVVMMASPIVAYNIFEIKEYTIVRVFVLSLVITIIICLFILYYYNSNHEVRKNVRLIFLKKVGRDDMSKMSVRLLSIFAISLIGYIIILECSVWFIEQIFDNAKFTQQERLSYVMSYIILAPIIAIKYLRLRESGNSGAQ